MRATFLGIWVALALGACEAMPVGFESVSPVADNSLGEYRPVAFLKPPFVLAGSNVIVIERFRDYSGVSPQDFIASPTRIARLWARQRLRAGGGEPTVRFVIEKAGARIDPDPGGETVTAVLEVFVQVVEPSGAVVAAGVKVDSQARISGDPSPEDRRAIYHEMSLDMAQMLDEKLAASVQKRLAPYLLTPEQVRAAAAPDPSPQPTAPAPPPVVVPSVPAPLPAPVPAPPPAPVPVVDSPLVEGEGRLPPSAWRKGWNWEAVR